MLLIDTRDCYDIQQVAPNSTSGVYTLVSGIQVYCDMTTAEGGWTVSRQSLPVYSCKGWRHAVR